MNYIVFDDTGKILRTGICPPDLIDAQAGEGEFVMEGEADDELHYIDYPEIKEKEGE